jgi:hypothetical protein
MDRKKLVEFTFIVTLIFVAGLVKAEEKILTPEDLTTIGENILKNGDFEEWSNGENKPPDSWTSGVKDGKVVKSGSYSAKLSADKEGHIFIEQRMPVDSYAGKTIIFGAWVKATFKSRGSVSILDWVGDKHEVLNSILHPGDETWQFLTVTKTIRKDATGEIWFRLNANPYKPDDAVNFDGAIAVMKED